MGRLRIKDRVLALDPFDVVRQPTDGQTGWAKWFKRITEGIDGTYHIRRIHYRTLGKPKPDGKQYENTTNDSTLLNRASEYARYLGMVDFDRVEDHKNEGETVSVIYHPDEISIDFSIEAAWLESSPVDNMCDLFHDGDSMEAINYGVEIRQPYHIEIWVEKSTVNDILVPIAESYNATLMVAGGQFSLTNVKDLFCRIRSLNKPIRIFYLRDFDPAGETMARAVARKIEWFVRTRAPEIDLKLFDLALNHEQCLKYQLPRTPMDRADRYKAGFEEKYGEGATELDALEAIRPGELAEIVKSAIGPYFDHQLRKRVLEFQGKERLRYHNFKRSIIEQAIDSHSEVLNPLVAHYNELVEQINSVAEQIEQVIDGTDLDCDFKPEYPATSSLRVQNEADPLLDTRLSYEEQLAKYRNAGCFTS